MAYCITRNRLKDGSTTYYIVNQSREPKTGKHKSVQVEKYYSRELERQGMDAEEYVVARLNALRESSRAEEKATEFKVDFTLPISVPGEPVCSNLIKNLGYAAYSKLYHQLGLDELINNRRKYMKVEYNVNTILQHLLYSRLLWPSSKLEAWENRGRFFGDTDYTRNDMYRCMDNILGLKDELLVHLDSRIRMQYGRKSTTVFYDVTNYYFERDDEDEEGLGLRARGVSKEHRPEPIIQMGLFMDELGIPITYKLFRGNTNDSMTFRTAWADCSEELGGKDSRKIIVADKGMMCFENILHIRDQKDGYVISQSIRKSDKDTVSFALDDDGWKEIVDRGTGEVEFKIKERFIPRSVKTYPSSTIDGRTHSGHYNERQVFVWSRKYADRARKERSAAVEKARDKEGTRSKDYKETSYGSMKYLTKTPVKKGEEISADHYIYRFDGEKLEEDEILDGYYLLCTNVVGTTDDSEIRTDKDPNYSTFRNDGFLWLNRPVPAEEILGIYGGLWKIEETFKITKTGMLNLRPVFHTKDERIQCHFLLCFIALVLERLLEHELDQKYYSKTIQKTLSSLNVTNLINTNIYQVSYYDEVADEINKKLDLGINRRFLKSIDVRKILGNTKKK